MGKNPRAIQNNKTWLFWGPVIANVILAIGLLYSSRSVTWALLNLTFVVVSLGVWIAFAARAKRWETQTSETKFQILESLSRLASSVRSLESDRQRPILDLSSYVRELEGVAARLSSTQGPNPNHLNLDASSIGDLSKGRAKMDNVVKVVEQIGEAHLKTISFLLSNSDRVGELKRVIEEIADKTNVVKDIAMQTRLLSFNASVEAARAGELGKGFAVVALEVGNLARSSATASAQISELIEASTKKVHEIVDSTRKGAQDLRYDGEKQIQKGSIVAAGCGDIFDRLVEEIRVLKGTLDEVGKILVSEALLVGKTKDRLSQAERVTIDKDWLSRVREINGQIHEINGKLLKISQTGENEGRDGVTLEKVG